MPIISNTAPPIYSTEMVEPFLKPFIVGEKKVKKDIEYEDRQEEHHEERSKAHKTN